MDMSGEHTGHINTLTLLTSAKFCKILAGWGNHIAAVGDINRTQNVIDITPSFQISVNDDQ